MTENIASQGAGEMAQRLRVHAALLEDQNLVPSTHVSGGYREGPTLVILGTCTHMHMSTHVIKNNKNKFKENISRVDILQLSSLTLRASQGQTVHTYLQLIDQVPGLAEAVTVLFLHCREQVAGVSEEPEQVLHRGGKEPPLGHQPADVTLPLPNTPGSPLPLV